jgi:hypothetical protein
MVLTYLDRTADQWKAEQDVLSGLSTLAGIAAGMYRRRRAIGIVVLKAVSSLALGGDSPPC